MKTLTGLDTKPEPIEESTPKEILETFPTYRKLLKNCIGISKAKDGDESIDLLQLGLKLKVEGDVSLEDAEFKMLKEKCSNNPLNWESHYQGQVMLKLKEAEK